MTVTPPIEPNNTLKGRFIIRPGNETDLVACRALDHHYTTSYVWQLAVQEQAQGQQLRFQRVRLPRPMEVNGSPAAEYLVHALRPPMELHVAEERLGGAARILAYITLSHEETEALTRVTRLAVTRTRRGEGIGTALLDTAANISQRVNEGHRANPRLRLEAQSTNYPAIRFATRSGFTFCGYDEQFYADGAIAVFFCRLLYEKNGADG